MKSVFRLATLTALVLLGTNVSAATLIGTFLDDTQWSLIHGGSSANATLPAADHLRWLPDQEIIFDLTGTTLSASGPQTYILVSDNMDFANFTLMSFSADLDNPDGFVSGSLDYDLEVLSGPLAGDYTGTFSFDTLSLPNFPFNSSSIENGVFSIFIWGGDSANDLGIDIGISAPVPLPAPVLLLLPGLLGLGLLRRR